ncbi:proline--tRNA ligase [Synechococcus sp. CCY9201]|uniref:proline--tRNA ligase n=1 Tax=unclassified Synechococcus TaxID=2626047 RepID=UPI002AD4BC0F|nr:MULTISPECIES: proline--tRNA ligase [unclassified Synechococcus]MEA5424071.1 proline--tRNA ligase [Synechococcus sp. CCY9202]MEA5473380.1 proline--tRNA ligase [Synechococcus sp. CCY9201]CAK6691915.1 Proline--tRNA ligase [Synechococcus sp. CBW1107]
MRVSRLMLVTLRDDPAEAEIASHKLLLRAGYIRRIASGIYAYLPLLWRVLRKVATIVREELDATGALETLLPQLQPADLWERSGRWAGYTAGEGIMFHLEDRQGRELGLGPTHEEVITALAAELLRSYRQLPVNLYQIQTKFRDEIRPRFGLMRGREFIMKDAYSFHASEACLRDTYAAMDQAYRRIFSRCGLRTVAVEADSGAIGGSASQEFMVTAEAGEDLILTSPDGRYAANQERAVSLAPEAVALTDQPCQELSTPGQTTIEQLCSGHGFDPSQIVKVLLLLARFADGADQPLVVSLRGDQQLNEVKLANAVQARLGAERGSLLELAPLTADQLERQGLAPLPFGSLGPDLSDAVLSGARDWTPRFLRLADGTAASLQRFVCGANRLDTHRVGARWGPSNPCPESLDLRAAQPGDRCQHDPSQELEAARGIEVGHIFQLGRKYSEALDARFTAESGADEALWMGCYGIGVSRLAQAAVEQNHDRNGICWPVSIAPFEVIVVVASSQDSQQVTLAERLYGELQEAGLEVLLDDRNERAGVKFKDADLIGIPWRLVVGRGAADGQVELVERASGDKQDLSADELLAELLPRIQAGRQGLRNPAQG